MTKLGALVTFSVVWWLVFFMALPFGARARGAPAARHVESAPARPAPAAQGGGSRPCSQALTTWGIAWLIDSGLIELRPR